MAKARIQWMNKGFRELLNDPGVVADLERRADLIAVAANASGDGEYATGSSSGGRRGRSAVYTWDFRAMYDNARNHTLLRSLDAGL